jgi:UDP-N-acetylglucosamine--N-acetylmuramyl-(pentapeptide) pyrophosphoryl-undecaprenol N-acetylglucosamine transferase
VVTRIRSRSHEEPSIPTGQFPTTGSLRRVLIVVGPTAGHVYPALAIADAYRAAVGRDVEVRFAGAPDGPAERLLAARGLTLDVVSGSQLVNVGVRGKLAAVPRVFTGMAQASRLMRAYGTRLVIGLGGYASGGVLLAARALGARVAIHEANVVPGLANRLLAPLVHRVYLGFAAGAGAFPARRRLVTGHPVRADIAALAREPHPAPERGRAARVLVLSSTRGAGFLAAHVPGLLAEIERRGVAIEALHQSGEAPADDVAHAYRRLGVKAGVVPYVDEVASAYRWADLVIARSGAGTIAEAAVAGVPALLVPLADASGDHQAANAAAVAAAGAGLAVREREWEGEALAARVAALLGDARAWGAAAAAARRLAAPEAAARIVADCETLMAGRW